MDYLVNLEQVQALNRFALHVGRGWRDALASFWYQGRKPHFLTDSDAAILHRLRNCGGPAIVPKFVPNPNGYHHIAVLVPKREAVVTPTGHKSRKVWRILFDGVDVVRPGLNTKAEARATAKSLGYWLQEPSAQPTN